MNQTTNKIDSDDKKMKIDWFNLKKMFLAQFEEIYSYIFLLSLITSSILDCYSIFLLISQSLSLRTSLLFYTTGPFGYS